MKRNPPAQVVVTPDTNVDDRIRSLYIDGRYSDREIAEALDLHRVTVTKRRSALGIKRADRKPAA